MERSGEFQKLFGKWDESCGGCEETGFLKTGHRSRAEKPGLGRLAHMDLYTGFGHSTLEDNWTVVCLLCKTGDERKVR